MFKDSNIEIKKMRNMGREQFISIVKDAKRYVGFGVKTYSALAIE